MSAITDRLVALLKQRRDSSPFPLNQPIPNPLTGQPGFIMPNPYPAGAEENELIGFSRRTGVKLPDDVTDWLKITNGAPGFLGVNSEEGADIEAVWKYQAEWQAKSWIPIGRDGFGNFYVRVPDENSAAGAVCFVESFGDELQYVVATNALHCAEFLLEEEIALDERAEYEWPFDKSFVLSKDPDLAKVTIAPLPWEVVDVQRLLTIRQLREMRGGPATFDNP